MTKYFLKHSKVVCFSVYFILSLQVSCSSLNTDCQSVDPTCNPLSVFLLYNNVTKQPTLVAVGTGVVLYSTNEGATWNLSDTALTGQTRSVASDNVGRWVLTNDGPPAKFYYSDDNGQTWTQANNTGGLSGTLVVIHYVKDRWWAADGSSNLAYSLNGIDWNFQRNFPGEFISSINGFNDTIMLVGDTGFNAFSSDFVNWTINTPVTATPDLAGLDFNTAGQVVATGTSAPEASLSSNFGVTWQPAVTTGIDFGEPVYLNNQIFATVSGVVNLFKSSDGLNYTLITTNSSNDFQSIEALDNSLYIAGFAGEIRSSNDNGQTWVQANTPTTANLNRIRGAHHYFAKPFWVAN